MAENQKDWSDRLPHVLAAYRASVHESTGYTPNYLMFGREVYTPIDLVLGRTDDNPQSYCDWVEERAAIMESAYDQTRTHLGFTAEREKRYYDVRVRPAQFKVGDWCWCYWPRRRVNRSPKWQRFYDGPYLVVKVLGPLNDLVQIVNVLQHVLCMLINLNRTLVLPRTVG